jgi:hypothetical protein
MVFFPLRWVLIFDQRRDFFGFRMDFVAPKPSGSCGYQEGAISREVGPIF